MSSIKHGDHIRRRIDEERVSVDSLMYVLRACCRCKDVRAHSEHHDPPDFKVTIDGEPFPAEVTSIVSHQQYHAQCKEFAEAIYDHADSLGILSGTYVFSVSRLPNIPKPTSKGGRQLLTAAIAYVDATRQQACSPEVQLAQDGSGMIRIEKVAAEGSIVGILRSPPAMWEGEIQTQLAKIIQRAVDDKMRKLQDAGIGPRRALLLLYDAFGYADTQDAIAALRQVNGYDWFHSIFWAASFSDRKNAAYPEEPGRDGFFLFSSNPSWNQVGTVPFETGS